MISNRTRQTHLARMLLEVTARHFNQYDSMGKPYALHALRVMANLRNDDDEELMCIALGHDLLEDTDVTATDLLASGFTDRIVNGIVALTKMPSDRESGWETYYQRVLANHDAICVKMADLEDNTDVRRGFGVEFKSKDATRMEKYHRLYSRLKSAR